MTNDWVAEVHYHSGEAKEFAFHSDAADHEDLIAILNRVFKNDGNAIFLPNEYEDSVTVLNMRNINHINFHKGGLDD